MTRSKKTDKYTITLDNGETLDLNSIIESTGDITINLNDTYGTTTTYWAGSNITDTIYSISDDITISDSTLTINTNSIDWLYDPTKDKKLDPQEVERMCKEYPGLEKVWRNFKSVYDMCKQDFEGKKKAGEIDDDIPF